MTYARNLPRYRIPTDYRKPKRISNAVTSAGWKAILFDLKPPNLKTWS